MIEDKITIVLAWVGACWLGWITPDVFQWCFKLIRKLRGVKDV